MDKKNWNDITYEELYDLFATKNYSDAIIAELYGVTKSQVASKRRKWDITMFNTVFDKTFGKNGEKISLSEKNLIAETILYNTDADELSKAIVQYAFRSGPIEQMHTDGKLNNEDMKALNKFMHNKIATILCLVKDKNFYDLHNLFNKFNKGTSEWDRYTFCEEDFTK